MDTKTQRYWYNRGWTYSAGPCTNGLEHGDAMRAPDEWYDGYLDYARGSAKWTAEDGTRRIYAP